MEVCAMESVCNHMIEEVKTCVLCWFSMGQTISSFQYSVSTKCGKKKHSEEPGMIPTQCPFSSDELWLMHLFDTIEVCNNDFKIFTYMLFIILPPRKTF